MTDAAEQDQQPGGFDHSRRFRSRIRLGQPNDDEWSKKQFAYRIADPPRQPNRAELLRRGEAAYGETCSSQGGAYAWAQQWCEDDETESVSRSLERFGAAGEGVECPCCKQCFQSISSRDAE